MTTILLILTIVGSESAHSSNLRAWTDNTGKHTVVASVDRADDKTVVLRKKDGSTITVPSSRLSKSDRDWLLRFKANSTLKDAWKPLIPTDEMRAAYKQMTSYQRYAILLDKVRKLKRKYEGPVGSLRLRVIAVIEPQAQGRSTGLALVHAQYVEQEYLDAFADAGNPTIGIWTEDFDVAKSLTIGDEFDLTGKFFYQVFHMNLDVDRVKSLWRQEDINTSVAYLAMHRTGLVRKVRIFIANGKITPVEKQPLALLVSPSDSEAVRLDQLKAAIKTYVRLPNYARLETFWHHTDDVEIVEFGNELWDVREPHEWSVPIAQRGVTDPKTLKAMRRIGYWQPMDMEAYCLPVRIRNRHAGPEVERDYMFVVTPKMLVVKVLRAETHLQHLGFGNCVFETTCAQAIGAWHQGLAFGAVM